MNLPQAGTCEVTDPVVNQKIETHGEVHRPSNPNANTVWLGVACREPTVLDTFVGGGVYVECILLPTPRSRKQRRAGSPVAPINLSYEIQRLQTIYTRTCKGPPILYWEIYWSWVNEDLA